MASCAPALLRLATVLSGDPARAEDLVQEALVKAYRHWPAVEAATSPYSYVRRIVVREHVSWWRRRSSSERPVSQAPDVGAPRGPDVAETHASREAAVALLNRLPRVQRTVLALRYYEDLSDAQIAATLGVSESTVRAHASRGLAALRAAVPDLDPEELP